MRIFKVGEIALTRSKLPSRNGMEVEVVGSLKWRSFVNDEGGSFCCGFYYRVVRVDQPYDDTIYFSTFWQLYRKKKPDLASNSKSSWNECMWRPSVDFEKCK